MKGLFDKNIFKTIISDNWEEFKIKKPQYNTDQYNIPVKKMLGCGEEFNGYSKYMCLHCGCDSKKIAFSCKCCFCLSCSKQYVDDFVNNIGKMLHSGVIYRHIVLTLPKQLRLAFFKERHDGTLLSKFMKCGYKCLEDVVCTLKRKYLKIGCIVVVQTHGRSGEYNPHLHIIMTSGGVDTQSKTWKDLGYFNYEMIHKKWQYHLSNLVKFYFNSKKTNKLVNKLWKEYPKGFVANVSKGSVPNRFGGLARYLAKYVASPPIAVRRILNYDGKKVKYWYQDHESKSKKIEEVDVYTFIGRMVQHIMPKGFKRVRYYGLESTNSFKKWSQIIRDGVKQIGRVVKDSYQIVKPKRYRQRYYEISGKDPMICSHCGCEMELVEIWHPKYGILYNIFEYKDEVEYESESKIDRRRGSSVWSHSKGIQLSLFPLQ